MSESPTVQNERRLNEICDQFEFAWKQSIAKHTPPPDFKSIVAQHQSLPDLALELAIIDMQYRHWAGDMPTVIDYPNLETTQVQRLIDFHLKLQRKESRNGQPQRFPRPFGEYILREELARGGMGIVFRATDQRLQRDVALKMILSGDFASISERDRFFSEAKLTATLTHPNIVPIYEVGEHEGQPFFTMRLIDGLDLGKLSDRIKLVPHQAARMMILIAEAVQHAHSRAILHRDLKPSNILIEGTADQPIENIVPFVTDFGLAKQMDDTLAERTGSRQLLGSPAYMAPEQTDGNSNAIGTATDVYGLGAVLYQMLSGKAPMQGDGLADLLHNLRTKEPISLSQLNAGVPKDLQTICMKALAKHPGDRYASAAEFAADLKRFLEHRPIIARPATPTEVVTKWIKRQPAVAALVAGLLLFTGLAIGLISWKWREAVYERTRADENFAAEKKANGQTRDALRRIRVANYFQTIARAEFELRSNNAIAARKQLESCDPELRGWEWEYLNSKLSMEQWSFDYGTRALSAVAFSPDSHTVATALMKRDYLESIDKPTADSMVEISIVDLFQNREIRRISGCKERIYRLQFTPDGQTIFAMGGDFDVRRGEITAWNIHTGKQVIEPIRFSKFLWDASLSPNGKQLAYLENEKVTISTLNRSAPDLTIPPKNSYFSLAYHPSGKQIAVGGRKAIYLFSTRDGTLLKEFTNLPLDSLREMAWHPSGSQLFANTYSGRALRLDIETGISEVFFRSTHRLGRLDVGMSVAIGDGTGGVHLFNNEQLFQWSTLTGHARQTSGVAFSPSGNLLASSGWDGVLRIWFPTSQGFRKGNAGNVQAIATNKDGSTVLVAAAYPETNLNTTTLSWWYGVWQEYGGLISSRRGGFRAVAMNKAGLVAYDFDRSIRLTKLQGNKWPTLASVSTHHTSIAKLEFLTDDQLVSASHNGTINLWHVTQKKKVYEVNLKRNIKNSSESISDFEILPNSTSHLLVADTKGIIRLWNLDTSTTEKQWQAPGDSAITLAIHPTKPEFSIGSSTGLITTFRLHDPEIKWQSQLHLGAVRGLDYLPDGSRLVSSGADGVRFWDTDSGELALSLTSFPNSVGIIRATPDGKTIIIGNLLDSAVQFLHTKSDHRSRDRFLEFWYRNDARWAIANRKLEIAKEFVRRQHSSWLKDAPKDPYFFISRGYIFARLGRWRDCLSDLNWAGVLVRVDLQQRFADVRKRFTAQAVTTPPKQQIRSVKMVPPPRSITIKKSK